MEPLCLRKNQLIKTLAFFILSPLNTFKAFFIMYKKKKVIHISTIHKQLKTKLQMSNYNDYGTSILKSVEIIKNPIL